VYIIDILIFKLKNMDSLQRHQSEPKRRRLDRDTDSSSHGIENSGHPALLSSFSIRNVLLFHKRSLEKKLVCSKKVVEDHAALKKECTDLLNRQRYKGLIEGEDRLTSALNFKLEDIKRNILKSTEKFQRLQKSVQDAERKESRLTSRRKYVLNILDVTKKLHEERNGKMTGAGEYPRVTPSTSSTSSHETVKRASTLSSSSSAPGNKKNGAHLITMDTIHQARTHLRPTAGKSGTGQAKIYASTSTLSTIGVAADKNDGGSNCGSSATSTDTYRSPKGFQRPAAVSEVQTIVGHEKHAEPGADFLADDDVRGHERVSVRERVRGFERTRSSAAYTDRVSASSLSVARATVVSEGDSDSNDDLNRGELDKFHRCATFLRGASGTRDANDDDDVQTVESMSRSRSTLGTEDRARVEEIFSEWAPAACGVLDDGYGLSSRDASPSPTSDGARAGGRAKRPVNNNGRASSPSRTPVPVSGKKKKRGTDRYLPHNTPSICASSSSTSSGSPRKENSGKNEEKASFTRDRRDVGGSGGTGRSTVSSTSSVLYLKSLSTSSDVNMGAMEHEFEKEKHLHQWEKEEEERRGGQIYCSSSHPRANVRRKRSSAVSPPCLSQSRPRQLAPRESDKMDMGEETPPARTPPRSTKFPRTSPVTPGGCALSDKMTSMLSEKESLELRSVDKRSNKARGEEKFENIPMLRDGRLWRKAESFYADVPQMKGNVHLDPRFVQVYEDLKKLERDRIDLDTVHPRTKEKQEGYAYCTVKASEDVVVTQLLCASCPPGSHSTSKFLRVEVYWPADALIQRPDSFTKEFTTISIKMDHYARALDSAMCDQLMSYGCGGDVANFLNRVLKLTTDKFWR